MGALRSDVVGSLLRPEYLKEARARLAKGEISDAELKFFVQQFSVFSNQFLVAALLKVINSQSLEQMHSSKQILLNELGVIYRKAAGGNAGRLGDETSG